MLPEVGLSASESKTLSDSLKAFTVYLSKAQKAVNNLERK